jgi:hypothetical protein
MIDFVPHPEVAMTDVEFDPGRHRAVYRVDYARAFGEIARGEVDARAAWRFLVLNDLFFVVCFVMQIAKANHPFVVRVCNLVQDGPRTDTVDVWAREHWKSVTITEAETIQDICRDPEDCHVIFSYKKPKAEDFLFAIKQTLEGPFLKFCFPEVFYQKPEVEAPAWSLQNGIVVKRRSQSRKEKTVEAYGIVEGMPTGGHWERRVYDDIETADLAKNPEQLEYLIQQYNLSQNLGVSGGNGRKRILGTFYSHFGLLTHVRDEKKITGEKKYLTRIIPATDDGTRDGKPVFLTQEELDDKKTESTFRSQQLCDPTPSSELKLHFSQLKSIDVNDIPRDVYKFMVLDQAGGDETAKVSRDMWSYGVIGVKPRIDEVGQSEVYLMDVEADKMSHAEGIDGVVRMYLRNGIIDQIGVEKVGMSTTEMHIANALRVHGRFISIDSGNLVLLKPGGRSKEFRVESALQWPLNNGKLYYSTKINSRYIQAIEEEMMKFPFFHVDILDMWAYVYDLIKEFYFQDYRDKEQDLKSEIDFDPLARDYQRRELSA